jgi:hypothetical protein
MTNSVAAGTKSTTKNVLEKMMTHASDQIGCLFAAWEAVL